MNNEDKYQCFVTRGQAMSLDCLMLLFPANVNNNSNLVAVKLSTDATCLLHFTFSQLVR